MLEHLGQVPCQPCPSVGIGEDWRFESEAVVGQALVAEGACIHVCVFPNGDAQIVELPRPSIRPPSLRRHLGPACPLCSMGHEMPVGAGAGQASAAPALTGRRADHGTGTQAMPTREPTRGPNVLDRLGLLTCARLAGRLGGAVASVPIMEGRRVIAYRCRCGEGV